MWRKNLIALTTLAFSLVLIAAALLAPGVDAGWTPGKIPPAFVQIEEGQANGVLARGETAWHQFKIEEPDGTPARHVNMSLVFTPNTEDRTQFIEFALHDKPQLARWYLGRANELQSLSQSFVVSRDSDPETGELFLTYKLTPNQTYYIRATNNSDFPIYYTIFIDVDEPTADNPIEPAPASSPATAVEPAAESAVDDLPAGVDPNHPIQMSLDPHEVRLAEGAVKAGGDHWFALEAAQVNGTNGQPLDLTLFVTPADGVAARKIQMDLFLDAYAHHWSIGDPESVPNFGAGRLVERDGDPLTGELVWSGRFNSGETYLVRLRNDNDFDVDFYLFTGDVRNITLEEPPSQPALRRVPPGADPHHPLPLETGVNEGDLSPGGERWYTLALGVAAVETEKHLQLTLYQTPNGAANAHRVHLDLFNAGDRSGWSQDNTESMTPFGSGSVVNRTNDGQTGTLFWDGWLVEGNEYLIRVRNGSSEMIHYWLFTGDIYNVELGESSNE